MILLIDIPQFASDITSQSYRGLLLKKMFSEIFFFFYKFIYFIYLFLAVLGLRCCARAFSSRGKRGPLFVAVHGPLTAVASLFAEHGLQAGGLQ